MGHPCSTRVNPWFSQLWRSVTRDFACVCVQTTVHLFITGVHCVPQMHANKPAHAYTMRTQHSYDLSLPRVKSNGLKL